MTYLYYSPASLLGSFCFYFYCYFYFYFYIVFYSYSLYACSYCSLISISFPYIYSTNSSKHSIPAPLILLHSCTSCYTSRLPKYPLLALPTNLPVIQHTNPSHTTSSTIFILTLKYSQYICCMPCDSVYFMCGIAAVMVL